MQHGPASQAVHSHTHTALSYSHHCQCTVTYLQQSWSYSSTHQICSVFLSGMTVKGQVVYNRVNLVRLVRRLDNSVNEVDWGTGLSWTQWLKSERVL